MENILIVEPYVFVKKNDCKIIFYNTIDGSFLDYIFVNETWIISENVIRVEINEFTDQYKKIILDLANKKMAFKYEGKKILAENFFIKIRNEFKLKSETLKLTNDELFNCISSITICINKLSATIDGISFLKRQIDIFSNADKCDNQIQTDTIKRIFSSYSFPNLNSIILTGDHLFELPSFYNIVDFLKKMYKIKLFITYSEYIKYFGLHIPEIEYHLICDNQFYEKFPCEYEHFLDKNVYFNMYVANDEDLLFLETYQFQIEYFQFIITPYYSNNEDFLTKLISYTKEELFESKKPLMQLVRNSLINELFFGSLVIHNDGEVYSNIQTPALGNIEDSNFSDIIHKASEDSSSWLYSRQLYSQCSNCLFNNMCPPVTLIEITSKLVYCKNMTMI